MQRRTKWPVVCAGVMKSIKNELKSHLKRPIGAELVPKLSRFTHQMFPPFCFEVVH